MTNVAQRIDSSKWPLAMFLLTALTIISSGVLAEETAGQKRVSITTQRSSGHESRDEFAELRIGGALAKSERLASPSKIGAANAQSVNADFWFYSADVELFNDLDRDGYYHGIDLLFDADTYYSVADVYAVVYLSLDGGPWNEYAATENFTLFGASGDDNYGIVTELVSGYPTGSYDVLIELFDAYDDSFLAYFGPDDTSELAFLPLEDADRDFVVVPEVIVVNNHHHGGGALHELVILMLGLTALMRHRRRRAAPCGEQT